MNAHMCPQVEVERESLSAALESALERLLPRVNKLVAFQFTALHKSLSTFGANMYPAYDEILYEISEMKSLLKALFQS